MSTIEPHPDLSHRQRALYWFTRAEASSLDEQLMIVTTLAKQIRGTMSDVLAVREVLLAGHTRECGR